MTHATLTAGGDATRLEGLSFGYADRSTLQRAARDAAFADAAAKAEQLAGLAGQTLGVVEAIDETPRHDHPAEVATIEAVSVRTTPLEFDLGRQTVTAAVTVRWAWA